MSYWYSPIFLHFPICAQFFLNVQFLSSNTTHSLCFAHVTPCQRKQVFCYIIQEKRSRSGSDSSNFQSQWKWMVRTTLVSEPIRHGACGTSGDECVNCCQVLWFLCFLFAKSFTCDNYFCLLVPRKKHWGISMISIRNVDRRTTMSHSCCNKTNQLQWRR